MRRRPQAAMAERAWTKFTGTLHPADDTASDEIVGDTVDEQRVVEFLDALAVLPCSSRKASAIDGGTPEGMVGHVAIRVVEVDPIRIQRCAQRTSRVAGRGRDEHAIESRLGENARVRDTVECHAATEAEIVQARFAAESSGDVDK